MLILDKQKAIEHVVRLTSREHGTPAFGEIPRPHGRTFHRVAVYERRAPARAATPAGPAQAPSPVVGRRLHPAVDSPLV